jgi:hypothetical protein
MSREHCHVCNRLHHVAQMHEVQVRVAEQTHWSPAEYDDALVCSDCFNGDGPDEDYERANQRYKESHGSEL